MKRLKYLLVFLMAFLILPFAVFAEGEESEQVTSTADDSKEVNFYFFRGEGCSHCAETEEWLQSIEEEYGSYFKVVDYETWYNSENADLMQKVAKARGETAEGVPYIIVGNKSWNGFTDSYKEEILAQITSEFEKDVKDRYDIMELVNGTEEEKSTGSDVASLIIILVVVAGICFGIYKARSTTN